ncbi:MAG: rhamnogalacturonan acetylesterase [Paraglaciecola sp.]|uniref:rhamnogalacturonan acetylesterase n=2 Tax=Paraglaciecola sp. TaxID=1920173 RepID=UPI0032630B14
MHYFKFLASIVFLNFTNIALAEKKPQLFMAGDSTMAIKRSLDYPETGWGEPFQYFFSDNILVRNLAANGRSTRTFISEGIWQSIIDNLQPGDFVIIQFGHNDEVLKKTKSYTTEQQFMNNLTTMIEQVRNKGGSPLLLSSITRRSFDRKTPEKIKNTHQYSPLVEQVAKKTKVSFIDMDKISRKHFETMGNELSKLRFMHIKPNLHPNYPNGVTDNTHLNQLGAREVAQLVLLSLKTQKHPLTQYIVKADPKHLSFKYR